MDRALPTVAALLVSAIGLLLPAGSGARAVEPLRTEIDLKEYRRTGSVYWKPTLQLRDFGYEDNVFLSDADIVADVTGGVVPQVEFLAHVGDRALIRARQDVAYTFFAGHPEQNFWASDSSARGDLYLTNWAFFADAGLITTRERPNDEFVLRPRRINRRLAGGARVEHAHRISLQLYALQEEVTFKEDDPQGIFNFRARLNRVERAAGGSVAYRAGRRTDVTLEAEARRLEFDEPTALTPVARAERLFLGLDWSPLSRARARFRAGPLRFTGVSLPEQSLDTLGWSAAVHLGSFRRVTLLLEGNRDAYLSSYLDNFLVLQDRGVLRVNITTSQKATLEFGGEISQARYSDKDADPSRVDRIYRTSAGVRLLITPRTSAAVRLSRFRRDSNLDHEDRRLTALSGSLVHNF
jgi:hypothetical protein